jgi:hypothetical protein
MFVTTTIPAQTQIVTVRRDGRGRVVRKGGRTVTQRVTAPGLRGTRDHQGRC